MIENDDIYITDKTEVSIPKAQIECCGDYLPGTAELDRFIKNVSLHNNDDIYRGKAFEYCPWCGAKK